MASEIGAPPGGLDQAASGGTASTSIVNDTIPPGGKGGQVGVDPFAPGFPRLLRRHYKTLSQGSGIADAVIAERGYRSALGRKTLSDLGFSSRQCRVPALIVPVWGPDGSNTLFQIRPDTPRADREGRPVKYETPKGAGLRLDCPPRCRAALGDPSIPLWVTEGMRKADAGASHALCCIALLGVWSFRGKNEKGGITLLADWDSIALNGREVRIVFDSDVTTKPEVQAALARLREHLQRKGAKVLVVYLPGGPNGVKVGLDDFLLTHTVDELQALVQAPAPEPQAALPSIELLDEAPPMLTRPLALVSGRAYAASWLWTRTTTTEYLDTKAGQVRRLREPRVDTERRLFVVRDDGAVFGDGADHGIAELGLQVALPSAPRDAKLWSTQGVKSYRAGRRADPRNVFERMVGTVDRFMSFDRSLADQRTMCEFVSCYALSTWFLDAFSVIGFLWPNGGYGSGKTKLGVLVCELAYLGEVLLSGSSYACLRDLADMGATLLFDDAEALSDPKRSDPDKRNLLLAGNRRGAVVAVKEAAADGTWKTRLVNAYCPRLFTAIRLPDSVLGSRSVVLPVVRTADAGKANAEVLEYGLWPTNQRQLLDDLWALALANLARMPEHEQAVNTDAPLTGRNLEPWRPALAVAHWLEAEGETGQYGRMCDLARSYQTERGELEYSDLTRLVVRALCAVVPTVDSVPSVPSSKWGVPIEFDSALVTTEVNRIATEEELAADGMEYASSQKVGRVLERTLRLRAATRTAKRKRRQVTPAELNNIALSYGISVPFIVPSPDPPASDLAHSAQTALSAQLEQAELPTVPFLPSAEWQDVPPGTVLPPGFEARMNFATGKNEARWPGLTQEPADDVPEDVQENLAAGRSGGG